MDTLSGPPPDRFPAPHLRCPVKTDEDVGAARRAAGRLAAAAGLGPGEAELTASELATNILRHARADGYLLLQAGEGYLDLIAADHGPGLGPGGPPPPAAIPRLSGPGLGIGLAAVRRQADEFDYWSGPDGTVILARFGDPRRSWAGMARWGAVNVPLGGAGPSGDGWLVAGDRSRLALLVADGLGHGPGAAAASRAAVAAVAGLAAAGLAAATPADLVLAAHEAMRGTRGGVLGAAVIDPARGELAYAGVGNISGWVLPPGGGQHGGRQHGGRQGLVSREGTAGTQARSPRPFESRLPWPPGATLILTSDGIRTLRDLPSYPRLARHDPAVAAAVLYRDHERGTDDATVLVVQDVRHGQS